MKNGKIKAGLISLVIIVLLTFIKFIAYWFSGSLAVFSEAWHSFSDIATTFMVVVTLWVSDKKGDKNNRDEKNSNNRNKRLKVDPELLIGGCISIWLFLIAFTILYRSFFAESAVVQNPLLVGIVFIVISFGSYFIYKLEAITAETEGSAALKADSQHNRTDMIISLLTGFSLVIYYFGIDIDRYIGAAIGVLILLFAIETGVNILLSLKRGENGYVTEYRITEIILSLFDKHIGNSIGSWLCNLLGISQRRKESLANLVLIFKKLCRYSVYLSLLFLFALWLSTAFYRVNLNQKALITRFGKISPAEILPGLHLKLPFPFEKVVVFDATRTRTVDVGNMSASNRALIWNKDHGDNLEFISADNNFFLPYISVSYHISDIKKYYLHITAEEKLIGNICTEEMISLFVNHDFFTLAIYKREEWLRLLSEKIQRRLDSTESGIVLTDISLKDFHPPLKVATAFEDIVSASQARETMMNKARVKYNVMMPEARLYALKTNSKATTEQQHKIMLARGYAQQYLSQLESFAGNPQIISRHLQLQTITAAIADREKIIYDPDSGVEPSQLYTEKFIFGSKKVKQKIKKAAANSGIEPRITVDRKVKRRAPIRD